MKMQELPENAITHQIGDCEAITIPIIGFEKLISFKSPNGHWVHKDYRVESKKTRKKGQKKA